MIVLGGRIYEHNQGEHPCGGWGFVNTPHICRKDSSSSLVIPSLTPSLPILGTSVSNVNAVSELNHKVLIFLKVSISSSNLEIIKAQFFLGSDDHYLPLEGANS